MKSNLYTVTNLNKNRLSTLLLLSIGNKLLQLIVRFEKLKTSQKV